MTRRICQKFSSLKCMIWSYRNHYLFARNILQRKRFGALGSEVESSEASHEQKICGVEVKLLLICYRFHLRRWNIRAFWLSGSNHKFDVAFLTFQFLNVYRYCFALIGHRNWKRRWFVINRNTLRVIKIEMRRKKMQNERKRSFKRSS